VTRASGDGPDRRSTRELRRRLGPFLVLLLIPWSVLVYERGVVTLLFPWGLVTPSAGSATTLYHYLFVYTAGLPDYILAWPTAVALYLLAGLSALAGVVRGREDRRLTAGLLGLAGIALLGLARGFSLQPGRFALPLGTLALAVVAVLAWRS
jgi:uncharacterized protein (TIGR04206 family)